LAINPINNNLVRYSKTLGFVAIEMFHNTAFHFMETLKVRGMARNLVSGDHSGYFKNKVTKQPLISGVVSGFMGAGMGGLTFMTFHNLLTQYLYGRGDTPESLR
jgi:hypothetical protein